jgi:branched-subunit amino acid permease
MLSNLKWRLRNYWEWAKENKFAAFFAACTVVLTIATLVLFILGFVTMPRDEEKDDAAQKRRAKSDKYLGDAGYTLLGLCVSVVICAVNT